jgi:hypothetical protein
MFFGIWVSCESTLNSLIFFARIIWTGNLPVKPGFFLNFERLLSPVTSYLRDIPEYGDLHRCGDVLFMADRVFQVIKAEGNADAHP